MNGGCRWGAQEHRAVLALRERVVCPENPATLSSSFRLASCLAGQQMQQQALPYAQRALAGRQKVLSREHPDTRASQQLVEELEKTSPKA